MRYASWSAGFAVQLLAFRRPWVVFYAKKVNCFVFASKRASACRSHVNMRAAHAARRRAGHTLGFVSALLSQISSHITKTIKGQESGGASSWFI